MFGAGCRVCGVRYRVCSPRYRVYSVWCMEWDTMCDFL